MCLLNLESHDSIIAITKCDSFHKKIYDCSNKEICLGHSLHYTLLTLIRGTMSPAGKS